MLHRLAYVHKMQWKRIIMAIQIGVRFHDGDVTSLDKRINEIKKQGFACTHFALKKAGLPGDPEQLTPGYASWLRKKFAGADLDMAILGCYLNLAYPDPLKLQHIIDTYIAHISFASILGCAVVGTETGAPNTTYTFSEACRTEEALHTFINHLKPIVRAAEKSGVILAIEPVCRHIVWNAKRARIVLDAINSPNLKIILDPLNLLSYGNVDQQEEIFDEALDLLGNEIAILHLKDFIRDSKPHNANDKLTYVGVGRGEMNYDKILRFVKEKKPYCYITLENTNPENAEQCRKYLEDAYNNLSL
jgi:sugar phosphate isomerase/epimerase